MFEAPCKSCGKTEGVTFGPDPYNADVNDDATPVWLCESCRQDRQDEI